MKTIADYSFSLAFLPTDRGTETAFVQPNGSTAEESDLVDNDADYDYDDADYDYEDDDYDYEDAEYEDADYDPLDDDDEYVLEARFVSKWQDDDDDAPIHLVD